MFASLFLLVYCLVALVNYSTVQSLLGSAAGRYLSKETGGTIKVGSISANILGQMVIHDVLWLTPSNDTVASLKKVQVKFDGMPFKERSMTLDKVKLQDGYYHLYQTGEGTSMDFLLQYLIDRFGKKKHDPNERYTVNIGRVEADRLTYRQTLPKPPTAPDSIHGVNVFDMFVHDCSLRVRNLRVCNDHVTCMLEKFTAKERSGFQLEQLTGNVYVASNGISVTNLVLESDSTYVEGDVLLDYPTWESMSHFEDSVRLFACLNHGTRLDGRTAGYWVETLWGVDDIYELEGTVSGLVNDLYCEDMLLRFGNEGNLAFDGHLQDITRFPNSDMKVDIYRLSTSHDEVASLSVMKQLGVKMPKIVKQMGQVELEAHLDGSIDALSTQATVACALGNVELAGWALKDEEEKGNYVYFANVSSTGLQLSRIVPNDWVSHTGCELSVQGEGLDFKTMTASVEGKLYNTYLRGNRVNPIRINAQMDDGVVDALVSIRDTVLNMKMDAHLDLSRDSSLSCNADVNIAGADLKRLKLLATEDDTTFRVVTHLKGNLECDNINDLMESIQGNLVLEDSHVERNHKGLAMDNIRVDMVQDGGEKRMNIRSDVLQARIDGYFSYASLPLMFRNFCDHYVPRYFNPFLLKEPVESYDALAEADINLQIDLNDPYQKLAFFLPTVRIADGTRLTGNYNYAESLKMVVRSDSIRVGGVQLCDVGVNCREQGGQYVASVVLDHLRTGEQNLVDDVGLKLSMDSRAVFCDLNWEKRTDSLPSGVDLNLMMRSDTNENEVVLLHNNITVNGTPWALAAAGPCIINREGFLLDGLRLHSLQQDQAIQLDATIQHQPNDQVNASFEHFDINTLAFLWNRTPLSLAGVIDGKATVYGLTETPYLNASLTVEDLDVNDVPLGDADIHSTWNAEMNQLSLYLKTKLHAEKGLMEPLSANGFIDMNNDDMGLDFTVEIDQLELAAAMPFVDNAISQLDGTLNGKFRVEGTLSQPSISGRAYIEEGVVGVDYLNTTFSVDDTIYIYPNAVRLKHMTVHDAQTGTLTVSGLLRHTYYKDMRLDFNLKADNFLCLDSKPHYDDFYGTLLIDANGTVTGTIDNLKASLNATTRKGTELHLPITSKSDVELASYIEFVDGNTPYYYIIPTPDGVETRGVNKEQALAKPPSAQKFNLTINLNATPDAHIYLPVETPTVSVDLAATGAGDLVIKVASGTDPTITGVYEIGSGSLDLSFLGLMSRKFAIAEGGTLTFPGDINGMTLDVEAINTQRVNTATLTGESSIEGNGQYINVQSVISMSGTMTNPEIGFDIRLPNADASVQEEVFSYIDRSNEIDMLNQTLSLLVFNRFYNNTTASNGVSTDGLSGGYSMVANTLGSLVSEAVEFVNVGFDYRSATELTGQQFDVELSKTWNKFYFESTFGFGTDARAIDGNANNTITGDVLLGYKMNPRLHFFVFNRSNTNDYTRSDLPFKQGVGMKYVRDFDKWSDLFKK